MARLGPFKPIGPNLGPPGPSYSHGRKASLPKLLCFLPSMGASFPWIVDAFLMGEELHFIGLISPPTRRTLDRIHAPHVDLGKIDGGPPAADGWDALAARIWPPASCRRRRCCAPHHPSPSARSLAWTRHRRLRLDAVRDGFLGKKPGAARICCSSLPSSPWSPICRGPCRRWRRSARSAMDRARHRRRRGRDGFLGCSPAVDAIRRRYRSARCRRAAPPATPPALAAWERILPAAMVSGLRKMVEHHNFGAPMEEIRFMINPELIISVLFFSSMEKNEAIEIIGAERFSKYTGYSSSFRFSGDYVDKKPVDPLGRRKTRIVAIDALRRAGIMQYQVDGLLRETNKAFCGFLDHSKHRQYQKPFNTLFCQNEFRNTIDASKAPNTCPEGDDSIPICMANDFDEHSQGLGNEENIGVATGNWGCGIFGGDPELKSIIQWLAASEAQRPFVLYFTVNNTALRRLEEVSQWIMSQGWSVGGLWKKLLEYSSQRSKGKKDAGLFSWLLHASPEDQVMPTSAPDTAKPKNSRLKRGRR
ncbi:hypothetical protein ACLOJK_011635 [Asimina triloba]